jgi:hypothetical protein
MEKEQLAPGIWSYTNVLENPSEFISDIEGLVEIKNLQWFEAGSNNGDVADTMIQKSIRDCWAISIPPYDKHPEIREQGGALPLLHDYLNAGLIPVFKDYCAEHAAFHWGENEGWQLLKYGSGHHFVNHYDDSKQYPRTISTSYYLNDNYEGGEIEFPRFGLKIKPKANQMIMFPANYVYNHTVHQVTSGLRYAVVGWWN